MFHSCSSVVCFCDWFSGCLGLIPFSEAEAGGLLIWKAHNPTESSSSSQRALVPKAGSPPLTSLVVLHPWNHQCSQELSAGGGASTPVICGGVIDSFPKQCFSSRGFTTHEFVRLEVFFVKISTDPISPAFSSLEPSGSWSKFVVLDVFLWTILMFLFSWGFLSWKFRLEM